jgi:hypothetical protein
MPAADPAPPPAPSDSALAGEREKELWRNLLLLIEAGEVVPIVGRELLEVGPRDKPTHLYSWLAERVAAELKVPFDPQEPTKDPLNSVACRYLATHDDARPIYINVFEQSAGLPALGIPEALLKLAAIDKFKLFVTTTFDGSLKSAVDKVRFNGLPRTDLRAYTPSDFTDLPSTVATLAVPTVFHLLGKVSPTANYVVTEEDALEFVHSLQSARPTMLFSELHRKDLLVIGCRFPAWLIRSFLRLSRPDRLLMGRGSTVFVVDTGAREDRALIDFLRTFRTRTEVFELDGPFEFVDQLYARWQERAARQTPAPDPGAQSRPREGSIFLSYASEDRAVVELIAKALAEAKLDVWFDREQLTGGDAFEDEIRTNVRRSSLFVPVLSRRCLDAGERYFRMEWKAAFRKAEMLPSSYKFVYPVVIDDVPYQSEALPSELTTLSWVSFAQDSIPAFVEGIKTRYRANQAR